VSRGRALGPYRIQKQQGRWKLLRAAEENAWPGEIKPKTSALISCYMTLQLSCVFVKEKTLFS
jgi:hypothetical protein